MTASRIVPRLGLLLALLFGAGTAAWSETLRAGGVGAATALLPNLFEAFEHGEQIKLEVIPGLGPTGGPSALGEGVLDMAVSGRMLNPEELARGPMPRVAVRTPFVLVTSHPRPNGLKKNPAVERFVDFLRSPAGQAALVASGNVLIAD